MLRRSAFARRDPARRPLLFVAAVILATFGLPVALGYSLLPQHVMPSIYPAGVTTDPTPASAGALTIDPIAASQMLPWGRLVANSLRDGRLPHWNPYSLTGLPLAANIQSATFFPLQLLQDLAPTSLWSVAYVLRVLVAGLFTFLFLRRVGIEEWSSAAGAVSYALCGTIVLYLRLEPVLNSTVALPIALYGVERAHGQTTWRNIGLGALGFACLIVSGQPEVTALNTLFLAAYSIFRLWPIRTLWPLTVYPAGALIAAPFVLPVVEYVLHAGSAKRDTFGAIALSPKVAVLQFAPYLLGSVHRPVSRDAEALFSWNLAGGYVGVAALYLAIVAVSSRPAAKLRGYATFAALTAIIALMKVYGLPPAQWIAQVPLLNQFFFTRYSGAAIAMAFAILVAIGAEAIGAAAESRGRERALPGTIAIVFVLSAPLWRFVSFGLPLFIALGTLAAMAGATVIADGSRRRRFVVAVLAVELMLLARPVLAGVPRAREIFAEPPFVSFLKDRQAKDAGRVYALDGFLYGNYAAAFGIHALNVCEGLIPGNVRAFASRYLDPGMNPAFFDGASPFRTGGSARDAVRTHRRFYDVAGVQYLMASPRSGALLEGAPRPFPRNRQNVAVGFASGDRVTARLRLDRDQLSGIKVLMATYGRTNRGAIVLRVRDAAGTLVAASQREASALVDNEYAEFRFEAIALTSGEDVFLEWEYLGAPPGDAVAFWSEPDSRTGYELQGARQDANVLPYIVQQSDAGWVQIYDRDARIWENPNAFPRAFVVPRVRVARTREEALNAIEAMNLREEAVVVSEETPATSTTLTASAKATAVQKGRPTTATKDVGRGAQTDVGRGFSLVSVTEMTPTRVALSIPQPTTGLLVLTDTYYPGWVAMVDGVPRNVYETNGAFRGVMVDFADREVVFEYRSTTFRAGAVVSVVMLAVCLYPWFRREPAPPLAAHDRV